MFISFETALIHSWILVYLLFRETVYVCSLVAKFNTQDSWINILDNFNLKVTQLFMFLKQKQILEIVM